MSTNETEPAYTKEQLEKIATPERYLHYTTGVKGVYPESIIDHFYDKLLHIKLPEFMQDNQYLRQKFSERQEIMIQYVLDFWNN